MQKPKSNDTRRSVYLSAGNNLVLGVKLLDGTAAAILGFNTKEIEYRCSSGAEILDACVGGNLQNPERVATEACAEVAARLRNGIDCEIGGETLLNLLVLFLQEQNLLEHAIEKGGPVAVIGIDPDTGYADLQRVIGSELVSALGFTARTDDRIWSADLGFSKPGKLFVRVETLEYFPDLLGLDIPVSDLEEAMRLSNEATATAEYALPVCLSPPDITKEIETYQLALLGSNPPVRIGSCDWPRIRREIGARITLLLRERTLLEAAIAAAPHSFVRLILSPDLVGGFAARIEPLPRAAEILSGSTR